MFDWKEGIITKKQDIIKNSIIFITEYYKGNLKTFFDFIADQVLWIGPREDQIISGKDNMIAAWGSADNQLTFQMGNINALSASTGTNNLEVILKYYVYTHFPSGETDEHNQRLHLSWGYTRENGIRVPKIFMIHVSNIPREPLSNKNGVKVYASSFSESNIDAIKTPKMIYSNIRMIYGKGPHDTIYYLNSATVTWIESTDKAQHSIIHTLDGSYKSIEKLRHFEDEFPDVFLRAHTSYLVNPIYVHLLKRFEVTMSDGAVLPIPQKKYTAFRKQLENWNR